MIATVNTRFGLKNDLPALVPPPRIAFFGDSMTASGFGFYAQKLYKLLGIPNTNYALGGTAVCTSSYAPTGGDNLIDKYPTEIALGYTGQLASFAYLQNDYSAGIVNATWKATYKSIIQAFITAGWPLTRLLLMNEPCTVFNAASRAPTRAYISQIASELGILFYDVFQRFVDTGVNDSYWIPADLIHPTDAGQDLWLNGYLPFLRR